MDRAHRLGQTKQVTVYRLICKGTIEERILERAREKSEIQRMVIQGGSFKGHSSEKAVSLKQGGEHLKPKEVVSLLLDDDEMKSKLMQSSGPSSGSSTPVGGPRSSGLKKRKWDDSDEHLSGPHSPAETTAVKLEPKKAVKRSSSSTGEKPKPKKS